MTGAERGFLLLCSHLGDPDRKCLTTAQFRRLIGRMRCADQPREDRELRASDLRALGYGPEEADRMLALLSEEDRLDWYLRKAERLDCHPITPFSGHYPALLEQRLGDDAPAVLWYRGDLSILDSPGIGLVGSRKLLPENAAFAREAGSQAARQGLVLISGNARGADRTAQDAALASEGRVISILADGLTDHTPEPGMLHLCEDSFDLGFSISRALSRNRLIHAMGRVTLVAQSNLKSGGTWDGSVKNLRFGWSKLYCFDDGQESTRLLCQMGAEPLNLSDLTNLAALFQEKNRLF